MVYHVTAEAVLDTADRAAMICLLIVILAEKIVAAIAWALNHARVLVSNLLPFELLAAVHLLRC